MTKVLFILIQWTWGLPQNLAGLFVYFIQKANSTHGKYRNAVVSYWKKRDSMSLGMFLFIGRGDRERLLKHEYGHSIQSLILGPFYLIVVGIPSILWCHMPCMAKQWRRGTVSYYSRYPENWADRLGHADRRDV